MSLASTVAALPFDDAQLRAASPHPGGPSPSAAPLSVAFASSLYAALCRDCGRAESDAGLLEFSDFLLEHCSTRALRLRGFGVGQHAATALLHLFVHSDDLRALHCLDLAANELHSFGLTQLLKPLQRQGCAVQRIDVSDNAIGAAGAREMARVLVDNTTVRETETHRRTHSTHSAVQRRLPRLTSPTFARLACALLCCAVVRCTAAPPGARLAAVQLCEAQPLTRPGRPHTACEGVDGVCCSVLSALTTARLWAAVCDRLLWTLIGRRAAGDESVPPPRAAVARTAEERLRRRRARGGERRSAADEQREPHSRGPGALPGTARHSRRLSGSLCEQG